MRDKFVQDKKDPESLRNKRADAARSDYFRFCKEQKDRRAKLSQKRVPTKSNEDKEKRDGGSTMVNSRRDHGQLAKRPESELESESETSQSQKREEKPQAPPPAPPPAVRMTEWPKTDEAIRRCCPSADLRIVSRIVSAGTQAFLSVDSPKIPPVTDGDIAEAVESVVAEIRASKKSPGAGLILHMVPNVITNWAQFGRKPAAAQRALNLYRVPTLPEDE